MNSDAERLVWEYYTFVMGDGFDEYFNSYGSDARKTLQVSAWRRRLAERISADLDVLVRNWEAFTAEHPECICELRRS